MIGRVYKITNNDESILYIGSTTQTLKSRWRMHKNNYRRWAETEKLSSCSIFNHFRKQGIDAFTIHLVSEHPVEDRNQLRVFEQRLINNSDCVNQSNTCSPYRGSKERIHPGVQQALQSDA
jgi:hypothetical protein